MELSSLSSGVSFSNKVLTQTQQDLVPASFSRY
jgi:hypothetical protein